MSVKVYISVKMTFFDFPDNSGHNILAQRLKKQQKPTLPFSMIPVFSANFADIIFSLDKANALCYTLKSVKKCMCRVSRSLDPKSQRPKANSFGEPFGFTLRSCLKRFNITCGFGCFCEMFGMCQILWPRLSLEILKSIFSYLETFFRNFEGIFK